MSKRVGLGKKYKYLLLLFMYYFFYVEKHVFLLPLKAEMKQENLPAAGAAGVCSSSHIKSLGNTCVFHYKIT